MLTDVGHRVVACSGGIDSLLLATLSHRHDPASTVVAHTVTPAVPGDGTARVMAHARTEGWHLEVVRSREVRRRALPGQPHRPLLLLQDQPVRRGDRTRRDPAPTGATVLSGANLDDLGEYRPGLVAAAEHAVRHPYVEAELTKADIRAVARHIGLAEAELPASPCLASRLYTGTRVTEERLRAIEVGEAVVRVAGMPVARCRVRGSEVLVEVPEGDRPLVTQHVLDHVAVAMRAADPDLVSVVLDDRPYRPGQAVLQVS